MNNEIDETKLGYEIKGAILDTYFKTGPGLLEQTYKVVLCYYLEQRGLKYRTEVSVPVIVNGVDTHTVYRIDILVEECYVIELKAVENMNEVFHAQILTYMRFGHYHRGYLVNFNTKQIIKNIFPKVTDKFID